MRARPFLCAEARSTCRATQSWHNEFVLTRALRIFIFSLLAAFAASSSVHAQSCDLYSSDFGSFSGPPDYSSGEFRVLWCVSGATITGSNFCPTGNALKLDSSSEDPVILVSTGASGCSAIEISFTYAQFAATNTVVKYGTTNATTASCSANTSITLGALTTTGGTCVSFSATIPLNGMTGAYIRFDHGANTNVLTIDDLVIRRTGCCASGGHPCCEVGSAGCADSAVSSCVCAIDPFCCTTSWDAQCVSEITTFACGSCAGGASCLPALGITFGTLYSGGSICTKFPGVFERCEGTAPFLTSSLGCATSSDMAMRFSQGFPYSAAITKCIDFSTRDAPALAFSYSKETGTLGPKIDVSLNGTTWTSLWSAPISYAGGCTPLVLDLAPFAHESAVWFRFASGSSLSSIATFDDIELNEVASAHACCEVGAPSCEDAATSKCTCAIDAYCCATAWDEQCIAIATVFCAAACPNLAVCGSPTAGDCFAAHNAPACEDAECCIAVCTIDAYCCDTEWDALCSIEAVAQCITPGDINRDGAVDAIDLATVLGHWGEVKGDADIDGSGAVDAKDLAIVLSHWTG